MNRIRTEYADKILLKCTENSQTLEAEILDYRPAHMITCSVNRQVKVYLRYNSADKNYAGSVGSLEFKSTGPETTEIKQGR